MTLFIEKITNLTIPFLLPINSVADVFSQNTVAPAGKINHEGGSKKVRQFIPQRHSIGEGGGAHTRSPKDLSWPHNQT